MNESRGVANIYLCAVYNIMGRDSMCEKTVTKTKKEYSTISNLAIDYPIITASQS